MILYQVTNAITVQPNVLDDINIVLPQFLGIFQTMQERCMKSLQVIFLHVFCATC